MLNQDILNHLFIVASVEGKHELDSWSFEYLCSKYELTEDEKQQVLTYLKTRGILLCETDNLTVPEDLGNAASEPIITEADSTVEINSLEDDSSLVVDGLDQSISDQFFESFGTYAQCIKQNRDRLKPRERELLLFRFGVLDGEKHTLEEVAQKYELTRERVRQIEARALRRNCCPPVRRKKLIDFLND